MLDISLLGTGGMMPLPDRFLTSLLVRYSGNMVLIDCGEGTQVTIKMLGWGYKQIGVICFTHFHADHISGLPGMLFAIANSGRTEPLIIIGPEGVKKVVDSLRVIVGVLPFQIEYYDATNFEEVFYKNMIIKSLPVEHRLPCFAYKIEISRKGKFNPEKAAELDLPVKYWSLLQNGETVVYDGKEFYPEYVMGAHRKGIKVTYTTDLRPSERVIDFARNSDLFICEGIYGEDEKLSKALEYKHTLFSEACHMAKTAHVKELWLTHFSPSLTNPYDFSQFAKSIFENTFVGKDRMTKTLFFDS